MNCLLAHGSPECEALFSLKIIKDKNKILSSVAILMVLSPFAAIHNNFHLLMYFNCLYYMPST